jgi:hypothetical protein
LIRLIAVGLRPLFSGLAGAENGILLDDKVCCRLQTASGATVVGLCGTVGLCGKEIEAFPWQNASFPARNRPTAEKNPALFPIGRSSVTARVPKYPLQKQ